MHAFVVREKIIEIKIAICYALPVGNKIKIVKIAITLWHNYLSVLLVLQQRRFLSFKGCNLIKNCYHYSILSLARHFVPLQASPAELLIRFPPSGLALAYSVVSLPRASRLHSQLLWSLGILASRLYSQSLRSLGLCASHWHSRSLRSLKWSQDTVSEKRTSLSN